MIPKGQYEERRLHGKRDNRDSENTGPVHVRTVRPPVAPHTVGMNTQATIASVST